MHDLILALADSLLYLDPGSGSFLIQLLLGLALGAGVAIKMFWTKIKGFVTGKKDPPQDHTDKPDDE